MGDEADDTTTCPLGRVIDDIGRYLAGDDDPDAIAERGQEAVRRGAVEVNLLLHSAFSADEVVASELRIDGPVRGQRRTVFAEPPTPVALLLLGLRLCDAGDEVTVMQHTAGRGTTRRAAVWPFGIAEAEEITRPPARESEPLPGL